MTRAEYLKYHRDACDRMVEITGKKNADYTGGSGADYAFSNFESVATWGVAPLDGFITRMSDKFARISTFVRKGVLQVSDESVEDTLLDLANYCILMSGYIRSKREAASEGERLASGIHVTDLNSGVKKMVKPGYHSMDDSRG